MKPERVDGPWDERNDDFIDDIPPPTTIQLRQFLNFPTFRPFQQKILDWHAVFDMRTIFLILDLNGHAGKSLFAEWMEWKGYAVDLMYTDNIKELMQQVYGQKKRKAYIADMPRALDKRHLRQFVSGVELLKNGVCYDPRYEWKKVRFDRPNVFMFSNEIVDVRMLSRDRWSIWKVTEGFDLAPLETPESPAKKYKFEDGGKLTFI